MTEARYQFLIEKNRCGHDELMHHIKARDQWLKIHLLVQATFIALAVGVRELWGFEASADLARHIPTLLPLSLPFSAALLAFHLAEDLLARNISNGLGELANKESLISESKVRLSYFPISNLATLPFGFRTLARMLVFLFVPTVIALFGFVSEYANWTWLTIVEIFIVIISFAFLGTLLWSSRRNSF